MVKIKTKKEFTKKELAHFLADNLEVEEYTKENDFKYKENGLYIYGGDSIAGTNYILNFYDDGPKLDIKAKDFDLFEVTVEEEITEETKIPYLLEICKHFDDGRITSYVSKNVSIPMECDEDSIAFHMINPDGTTTLLWTREGGMVE